MQKSIYSLVYTIIMAMTCQGCESRSEKKVSVTCAQGKVQSADGKCTNADDPSPSVPVPAPLPEPYVPESGAEETGETEDDFPQGDDESDTDEEYPNSVQPPVLFPPNTSPNSPTNYQPNTPTNYPPNTSPNSPIDVPSNTSTNFPVTDPATTTETVNFSSDVTRRPAEGPPTIKVKLVHSMSKGWIAKAAFSYKEGITNAKFTYHKQVIDVEAALIDAQNVKIGKLYLPLTITFDLTNKTCTTSLIKAETLEKLVTAKCA